MNSESGNFDKLKEVFTFLVKLKKLPADEFNKKAADYLEKLSENYFKYPELSHEINAQISAVFITNSLTNAGINSNRGFFPELKQRLKHSLLPTINENHFLSHLVSELFYKKNDYIIFEKLSDENYERLFKLIASGNETISGLKSQVQNALIILSHRLVSIGIDPYLVNKLDYTDDNDSPFFEFNNNLNNYISNTGYVNLQTVFEKLEKCKRVFDYLKDNRETLGISLHLTFIIRRAEQHINRIKLLLELYSCSEKKEQINLIRQLLIVIVKAELYTNSIRYFISENTGLLANRIANQTSGKGGDYIGFTKNENKRLLRSAMGGGLVVVFLVYLKHFIHLLHLPLLPEGILFGLNYGFGFVFMHLLHLTLATKQPAMTASYIAASIEQMGLSKSSRKSLSLILAQIMRSQFISLIGNLIVVLPLSFLSARLFLNFTGFHVFDERESYKHLMSNHPVFSGSLLFAVFTGIFLTLAGLITGYYDNKVVFSDIPNRIIKHPFLKRVSPETIRNKFARFISKNLGAIVGNMALGMFLGLTGNFGKFIGIPIDIRHITISAGNFAISTAQAYPFSYYFIAVVFMGVLLIGLINIISSFLFSFIIACRSRYLSNKQTFLVFVSMLGYIVMNPRILLFRKEEAFKNAD